MSISKREIAEKMLIGSMILDSKSIIKMKSRISKADFSTDTNKQIYTIIMQLHKKHKKIDLVTVRTEMKKIERLRGSRYIDYLVRCVECVNPIFNIISLCRYLRG
jgi:replicative DNA helicase